MIVTTRAGLFAKHGLQVEIRMMGGAVGVVKGLQAREIQFGNLAAPALLRADLLGEADLVFLTGGINQQFIMGRPGIKRRDQLAGGTIGIVGDAGLNDVLVHFITEKLEADGIEKIRKVAIPGGEKARVQALVDGRCDALVITPPSAFEAKRKGCRFLIDFADYGLNYALGGIAARRDYVLDNEEITRNFVKAYVEGMHRYRTDRSFTVQVQQEYSGIEDRSIAEQTYDVTQPGMPQVPRPVIPALEIALKVMARDLPDAQDADPRRFVDERFIRELEESGFIASLTHAAG